MRHKLSIIMLSLVAVCVAACAPKLGDECSSALQCSALGDRYCDVSAPGGYCTIMNCEPGECGDEGVCVRFKPDEPRLSSNWCMAKCGNTGDCDRDRYVCRSAEQLNASASGDAGTLPDGALRKAEPLDNPRQKFCVVEE